MSADIQLDLGHHSLIIKRQGRDALLERARELVPQDSHAYVRLGQALDQPIWPLLRESPEDLRLIVPALRHAVRATIIELDQLDQASSTDTNGWGVISGIEGLRDFDDSLEDLFGPQADLLPLRLRHPAVTDIAGNEWRLFVVPGHRRFPILGIYTRAIARRALKRLRVGHRGHSFLTESVETDSLRLDRLDPATLSDVLPVVREATIDWVASLPPYQEPIYRQLVGWLAEAVSAAPASEASRDTR